MNVVIKVVKLQILSRAMHSAKQSNYSLFIFEMHLYICTKMLDLTTQPLSANGPLTVILIVQISGCFMNQLQHHVDMSSVETVLTEAWITDQIVLSAEVPCLRCVKSKSKL